MTRQNSWKAALGLGLSTAFLFLFSADAGTENADSETRIDLDGIASWIRQARPPGVFFPAGELPRPSQSRRERNLALAALQVEKARDHLAAGRAGNEDAEGAVNLARRIIKDPDGGAPPENLIRPGILECAYFADNDDSPQPYFLHLPKDRGPGKKLPLVVFLHGWVPETCRTNPWLVSKELLELCDANGTALVVPHGRTNTDFQFAGERDVLRVIAEMKAFYGIDPERIYLTGVSMGGAGVWQIGMHYPDIFAGLAPINAQAEWFHFWNEHFGYPPKNELPGHVRWLLSMHNPPDLSRNLGGLYVYCQHATGCFLGVGHTRELVGEIRRWGTPCDFLEDPSALGHYSYQEPGCFVRVFGRLLDRKRLPNPEKLKYATRTLRHPGAWWARMNRFISWGPQATLEAEHSGNSIAVRTENAEEIELRIPPAWTSGGNGSIFVNWNGREIPAATPDAAGTVILRLPAEDGAAEAGLIRKSTAVCGPASDVFNFPFVAAYGTTGTPDETKANMELAGRFASDWYAYAEGKVRILRDTEISPALMKNSGLVLFGLPETNSIIKSVAHRLPIRLSREKTALPCGRAYNTEEVGLVLTYPNPLAPERYLLIMNNLSWGAGRTNNHRFDLLPDFAIFGPEALPGMGINRFLAAGFFDERWRYSQALTDYALPAK